MQGEYRGDFTRDTFHQANHFCRVLMQQGRVQLDADWNEQASVLLHYLRSLGADLIGQHGGPAASGFAISPVTTNNLSDFQIGYGNYYVDGILCEFGAPPAPAGSPPPGVTYLGQPDFPNPPAFSAPGIGLFYLDVWERHVTGAQQDLLTEVALGGPDTATRAKVICQVKLATNFPLGGAWPQQKFSDAEWQTWVALWQAANRGTLKAQVKPEAMSTDACVISAASSYRGTENQLYRVEIHNGGTLQSPAPPETGDQELALAPGAPTGPSYKWSRENGSVVFPILSLAISAGQTTVVLSSLGRDSNLSLQVDDWVEVVDDNFALSRSVDLLLKVVKIDSTTQMVTLAGTSGITVAQPPTTHPLLRRWDGIGPIVEGSGSQLPNWLNLEDGLQVQFQPAPPPASPNYPTTPNQYRSGDYWLIPARVATGNIEWPQLANAQGPAALPPHGVEHHYAPLALATVRSAANGGTVMLDLRRTFAAMAT
jgi:hypothetical protein